MDDMIYVEEMGKAYEILMKLTKMWIINHIIWLC